jgi:hypothetical protein
VKFTDSSNGHGVATITRAYFQLMIDWLDNYNFGPYIIPEVEMYRSSIHFSIGIEKLNLYDREDGTFSLYSKTWNKSLMTVDTADPDGIDKLGNAFINHLDSMQ